jgi:hypothetical protein
MLEDMLKQNEFRFAILQHLWTWQMNLVKILYANYEVAEIIKELTKNIGQ